MKLDSTEISNYYLASEVNTLLVVFYTKSYVDTLISSYQAKDDTNVLLDGKVNTSFLANYTNTSDLTSLLSGKLATSALNDYTNTTDLNTLLNAKVNTSTLTSSYYLKTAVDSLLGTYYTRNYIIHIFIHQAKLILKFPLSV